MVSFLATPPPYRNTAELVYDKLDSANDGAGGVAVFVGLVEGLVRAKGFVGFAAMSFEVCADSCVQLGVSVRVCQVV
jgi:hypothetical protein